MNHDSWRTDASAPESASVRSALATVRELESSRASPEDKARALAGLLTQLDAWRGRQPADGDAGARRGALPLATTAPPAAAPSGAKVRDLGGNEAALSFALWAELSVSFLNARPDEKVAALAARALTPEAWARLDDDSLRLFQADLLAGRSERPALYASRCREALARRPTAAGLPAEVLALLAPGPPRAPDRLRGTAEAVDLPAMVRAALAKLPFGPPAPAGAKAGRGAAKTAKVPVMRATLGETFPLGSDAIHKAIAALPFAGSAGVTGVVSFPALTVQQYVSLRADLASRPERRVETLTRYRVPNEASWRALDEHWQKELSEHPELRAELEVAVATYTSWLRGTPR